MAALNLQERKHRNINKLPALFPENNGVLLIKKKKLRGWGFDTTELGFKGQAGFIMKL